EVSGSRSVPEEYRRKRVRRLYFGVTIYEASSKQHRLSGAHIHLCLRVLQQRRNVSYHSRRHHPNLAYAAAHAA
ncbi:MAG TPA: hypothetical protein PLP17_05255, partial [Oligoflexia bacterium]|nr:hypothetical protein [Oligoflexia bacterium]